MDFLVLHPHAVAWATREDFGHEEQGQTLVDTFKMLEFALGYGLCVIGAVMGALAGFWGPVNAMIAHNPMAATDGIGVASALFLWAPSGAVLGGLLGHKIGIGLARDFKELSEMNNYKR